MPAALYELAWPQLALLSAGLAFLTTTAWVLFPGPLKTERVRLGIVSLELARSSWKAREILDSWREARMLGRASRNIQWDFAFIPTYTAGAAVIGIVAARLAAEAGALGPTRARDTAAALAWAAISAGLLDVGENIALRRLLAAARAHDDPPAKTVKVGSTFAIAKFALLAGILLAAGALVAGSVFAWLA